jgi:hypothetical protein
MLPQQGYVKGFAAGVCRWFAAAGRAPAPARSSRARRTFARCLFVAPRAHSCICRATTDILSRRCRSGQHICSSKRISYAFDQHKHWVRRTCARKHTGRLCSLTHITPSTQRLGADGPLPYFAHDGSRTCLCVLPSAACSLSFCYSHLGKNSEPAIFAEIGQGETVRAGETRTCSGLAQVRCGLQMTSALRAARELPQTACSEQCAAISSKGMVNPRPYLFPTIGLQVTHGRFQILVPHPRLACTQINSGPQMPRAERRPEFVKPKIFWIKTCTFRSSLAAVQKIQLRFASRPGK